MRSGCYWQHESLCTTYSDAASTILRLQGITLLIPTRASYFSHWLFSFHNLFGKFKSAYSGVFFSKTLRLIIWIEQKERVRSGILYCSHSITSLCRYLLIYYNCELFWFLWIEFKLKGDLVTVCVSCTAEFELHSWVRAKATSDHLVGSGWTGFSLFVYICK